MFHSIQNCCLEAADDEELTRRVQSIITMTLTRPRQQSSRLPVSDDALATTLHLHRSVGIALSRPASLMPASGLVPLWRAANCLSQQTQTVTSLTAHTSCEDSLASPCD